MWPDDEYVSHGLADKGYKSKKHFLGNYAKADELLLRQAAVDTRSDVYVVEPTQLYNTKLVSQIGLETTERDLSKFWARYRELKAEVE